MFESVVLRVVSGSLIFLEVCLAHEERDAVIGKPEGIDAEPEVS